MLCKCADLTRGPVRKVALNSLMFLFRNLAHSSVSYYAAMRPMRRRVRTWIPCLWAAAPASSTMYDRSPVPSRAAMIHFRIMRLHASATPHSKRQPATLCRAIFAQLVLFPPVNSAQSWDFIPHNLGVITRCEGLMSGNIWGQSHDNVLLTRYLWEFLVCHCNVPFLSLNTIVTFRSDLLHK